jgi:uncharacterized protein YqeY
MLEERIEQDIKTALLGGEKTKVLVLRGVKAKLLDLKVANGKRESGLSEDEVLQTLAKQSKQRQESADLYEQGGDKQRRDAELSEKEIIDAYLPQQLTENQISKLIDEVITETGLNGAQAMGQLIGQVKKKAGPSSDGAVIARLVKEKLT